MEIYESEIWDTDVPVRLDELAEKIKKLQDKYGVRSIIRLDAGYNNVSLHITPSKKVKGK